MIVHPDFLDHWKTKKLVETLGDPSAPLLILRLWAYCQMQRKNVFEHMDAFRLKSVCHTSLPGDKLIEAFADCGFIRIEDNTFIVHDWEVVNRMLVSAWANGQRGGDPAKFRQPDRSQSATQSATQSTRARVREEDKIRAGYPVGSRAANAGDQPAGDLASPERGEESQLYEIKPGEKPDPANIKKFGKLMKGLAEQLRGGSPAEQDSISQVKNLQEPQLIYTHGANSAPPPARRRSSSWPGNKHSSDLTSAPQAMLRSHG